MSRMKTFAIYLLLFIGLYVVSNILISALIKTSYYKIDSYEIKESQLTVTIMNAKASKDNGYIEGKISNSSDEDVYNKYMKVELFSENNVSLGKEYVKVDEMKKNDVKNFTVNFNYDIVKHFEVLSENGSMTKEFNLISYNGAEPKYDIRSWQTTGEEKKLLKGITLTLDEIHLLKEKLNELDEI